MGRAMLSKSLIQFSIDGRGCVPSLLFDLRPNYGGGSEDSECPQPCSRPSLTHTSTRDSWTLAGKSGLDPWLGCCCGKVYPYDAGSLAEDVAEMAELRNSKHLGHSGHC